MSRLSPTICALALSSALFGSPAQAGPRAFVASTGNDANTATSCAPTTPCRSFTAALTVVDAGGEIVALDAAGYGAVTITKSVSLIANPGFYAGIAAGSGNAITIATASINVVLRGLNINGVGANNGVSMTDGAKLSIENCVISNFNFNGVFVDAPATVRIVDSLIRDNYNGAYVQNGASVIVASTKFLGNSNLASYTHGSLASAATNVTISDSVLSGSQAGVVVVADGGTTANVSVSRSTSSNNLVGILNNGGGGTSAVNVSGSQVTGNSQYGFYNFGSTFESQGNNTVRFNGTNSGGTITAVSGI